MLFWWFSILKHQALFHLRNILISFNCWGNRWGNFSDKVKSRISYLVDSSHHLLKCIWCDFYADFVDHEKLHHLFSSFNACSVRALFISCLTIDHLNYIFIKNLHFPPVFCYVSNYLGLKCKNTMSNIPKLKRILFHIWFILCFLKGEFFKIPQIMYYDIFKVLVQTINRLAQVWKNWELNIW